MLGEEINGKYEAGGSELLFPISRKEWTADGDGAEITKRHPLKKITEKFKNSHPTNIFVVIFDISS